MATLNFYPDQRIIEVAAPAVEVTDQEIINAIATQMEDLLWLEERKIAEWSGKTDLQLPGEATGITLTLLNDWRIKFEDRAGPTWVKCTVVGGNLTALLMRKVGQAKGDKQYPVAPAAYVSDSIAQAVSPTFSTAQANRQLQYLVETKMSLTHFLTGDVYYVDPVNGDDVNDGTLPERVTVGSFVGPKKTFAAALAECQSAHHDGIMFVQSQVGAPSVLTENLVIDKEDITIRGPGSGFHVEQSDNSQPNMLISAAHVECTGFRVKGDPGGSADAVIKCTSTEPRLANLTVQDGNSHGILATSASGDIDIENCAVRNHVGSGIRLESVSGGSIRGAQTLIDSCDIGVQLTTGAPVDGHIRLDEISIIDSVSKGVRIDADYESTIIAESTRFINNGTGQPGGASRFHDIDNSEPSTVINLRNEDVEECVDRNADLIESQRGHHTWQSDNYYVDPTNGDDNWTGTRRLPFKTVTAAVAAATDSNHDVIHLMSTGAGGATETDEQVTINKRFLFVRGPGPDFLWKSTIDGDVITVTAEGVELSGFATQTAGVGTGRCIDVDGGDFANVHNVVCLSSQSDAIRIKDSSRCTVERCTIDGGGVAGHGVHITGTSPTQHNEVRESKILGVGGDGVRLSGGASVDCNVVRKNLIHDSGGAGVKVDTDVDCTQILSNYLSSNTEGPIVDNGNNTYKANNKTTEELANDVETWGAIAS